MGCLFAPLKPCTQALYADSFQPGEGHEPAGQWVGGPHDGMGPECIAERARTAPKSGSNHKRIVVRHPATIAAQWDPISFICVACCQRRDSC